MTVNAECDGNAAISQHRLDGLGGLTEFQHPHCERMAEVMEPNGGKSCAFQ